MSTDLALDLKINNRNKNVDDLMCLDHQPIEKNIFFLFFIGPLRDDDGTSSQYSSFVFQCNNSIIFRRLSTHR